MVRVRRTDPQGMNAQAIADFFRVFSQLNQSRRYRELSREAAHVEGQAKIQHSLLAKWNRKGRIRHRRS
jgi:hypothetical protein